MRELGVIQLILYIMDTTGILITPTVHTAARAADVTEE